MHLIDTHTHIYGEEFDQDRSEMIQRSIEAGVKTLILPAIDPESFDRQEALWEAYQSPTENPEIPHRSKRTTSNGSSKLNSS